MDKLSVEEVVQLAISMEEEGVKFYEDYANKTEGTLKDVMLALAEDERQHVKVFQKLFAEIQEKSDYLFDDLVLEFFGSYTKSKGFNRPKEEITSVRDAIRVGVETEGVTIKYYESLLKYATDDDVKDVLNRLIREEEKHKKLLEKLLILNEA